jgi:hypothetical protein
MLVVVPVTVLSMPVHTQPCQSAEVTFQFLVWYQPGGLAPLDPVLPADELELPPELPALLLLDELELLPPELPALLLLDELELLPPELPALLLLDELELLLPPELPALLLLDELELLPPELLPPLELLLEELELLPPLELLFEELELPPPLDWVLPPLELLPPPLAGEHPSARPTARAGMRSNRRVFLSNASREVILGPPSIRVQTALATGSGTQDRTKTKELVHHSVRNYLKTCRGPVSLWRAWSHRKASCRGRPVQRGSGPPGSRIWSRTLSSSRSSMVWPP